jgi:hypothetical protein
MGATSHEGIMRQFRVGLTIASAAYGVAILAAPQTWSFIDGINLPVHESGHLVFAPFGASLELLGGTLMQLLFPLAIAAYFTLHGDEHASSLGVWWVGQNFVTIGTYIGDAQRMALPLVDGGAHDWNLLFSQWGLLAHTTQLAQLVRGFGFLVMLVATVWGAFEAANAPQRSSRVARTRMRPNRLSSARARR